MCIFAIGLIDQAIGRYNELRLQLIMLAAICYKTEVLLVLGKSTEDKAI